MELENKLADLNVQDTINVQNIDGLSYLKKSMIIQ
jgi:hypothetical protein